MRAPLVVGIGNPDRGDDAIGLRVAGWLRELAIPGIEVAEASGEPAQLLDLLRDRPQVWLIDGCVSGAATGTLHEFDAGQCRLPVRLGSTSSHGLGAAEAIELARALGELPGRCVVLAIEGAAFERGARLTPEVGRAGEALVRRLASELRT